MGHCKDCKYWYEIKSYNYISKKYVIGHKCFMVSECYSKIDVQNNEAGIYADALDDTDLESLFITGPDFGCVNFTERGETK